MGPAHLDLPSISAPTTTGRRSNGTKKVFSPSNFILKHAKVHRYQIERDNMEVKALFSYLSQIYRSGCGEGEVASDYSIHQGIGVSRDPPTESYGNGYMTNYLLPITSSKIESRNGNSSSSSEALRNYYFSSCSISSTSPEKPRVDAEVPFPFIDNWGGLGGQCENVSQSPFLVSLRESGLLPLQILLGSIPGVDTSSKQLPLISPFMAAMTYLESIGMGFYGMQFSDATTPILKESSIVSSDAISSEIEGQGDGGQFLESCPTINKKLVPAACGSINSLYMTEVCEGNGEINFNCPENGLLIATVGNEENERNTDSDCCDTSSDGKAKRCSNDDGDNISSSSVGTSVPQQSGRAGDNGSIVSENDSNLITANLTDSMSLSGKLSGGQCNLQHLDVSSIEDVSAYYQAEMPPTDVIDAAFDLIENEEKHSSAFPFPESSFDLPPILHESRKSSSSIAGDSQGSPTSVIDIVPRLLQPAPTSALYCCDYLNNNPSVTEVSSAPVSLAGDSYLSLDPPTSDVVSNISSLSCSEKDTGSIADLDRIHGSSIPNVPPFFLSALAFSDAELADLTVKYNLQVELDSVGGGKLCSIESALKYFDQIATSSSQNSLNVGGTEDLVHSSRSEEGTLAADALRSFSETLQLSARITDLKNYPPWGPSPGSAVPPFAGKNGTEGPCSASSSSSTAFRSEDCPEQDIRLFGEMLRDKIHSATASTSNGTSGGKVRSPFYQGSRLNEHPISMSTAPIAAATTAVPWDSVLVASAPSAVSCAFNVHQDFMNLSDTSGAVALLALMSDCVCSSEFDCYFDDVTSFPGPRKREREEVLSEAKRRKSNMDEMHGEQLTSRRQQRCPKCGEFKKGHICRFLREVEPVSPRSDF
jgi:hypothetical protein